MRDIVLEHAPRNSPIRVLDLGCGTGSLLFRLADALPNAELTGIDVSAANIATAERNASGKFGGRVRFAISDYLAYRDAPFDLIVSDGVLHLIAAPTDTLIRKLAADLVPGGLLICDLPYDCAYNRAFSVVRRMLRAVRSSFSDRLILSIARLVHAGDMTDDQLRERVQYMYFPPQRMMDRMLTARFASAGFRQISVHQNPSTSASQLRHNVTVWSKAAAA